MAKPKTMTSDQLGKKAKAEIEFGEGARHVAHQAVLQAEQHFIRAGKFLLKAKEAVKNERAETWLGFLERHGIAERTAQEKMALANGRTTLKKVRAEKSERVRKSREKARYRNADIADETVPLSATQEQVDVVESEPSQIADERPQQDLHAEFEQLKTTITEFVHRYRDVALSDAAKRDVEAMVTALESLVRGTVH